MNRESAAIQSLLKRVQSVETKLASRRYANAYVLAGRSNQQPLVLAAVTGIDGTAVATTNLYTPVGYRSIVTGVVITLTAVDTFTSVPDIGIGIAAGEDDIISSRSLTGLSATQTFYKIDVEGLAVICPNGSTIKLGVDTGAVATTYTMTCFLLGYLLI